MPWFGNQYYDPKKKKWKTERQRKKPRRYSHWWAIAMFLSVSLIITLALNYLYPGTKFFIIGW